VTTTVIVLLVAIFWNRTIIWRY